MSAGRLYLDAFGESGRTLTSQSIYAVCILWLPGTDATSEALLADIRKELGLKPNYEFHARKLTKQHKRENLPVRLFEALLARCGELQVWCAVMHKAKSRLPPKISGMVLFHEMVSQSVVRMPEACIAATTLTFDEQQASKKPGKSAQTLRKHLNAVLGQNGKAYQIGRVIAKPAHQSAGLQLADFMAAAIATPWSECLAVLPAESVHTWRT